ncbi:MAG: DUF488 domain-containing protein [Proteobacteria bacterium]|nr:DUF488 domain-containing protein [Pseudomonadota bacterium]
MKPTFYTVGHSNHSLPDFLALLAPVGVECLVDIRKLAGSRAQPQFNADTLAAALALQGLDYVHLTALAGLRGRTPGMDAERNGWWDNASFHRYADYACTPAFAAGLQELLALGEHKRCALMCAEAVWWRCHRRIVTDHLLARGCQVLHIMGLGKVEAARLSSGAVVGEGGVVTYPVA